MALTGRHRLRSVLVWLLPTLAAAALRVACLGRWSLWADEVSTLTHAWRWESIRGYPVGYFLIGLTTRLFGDSAFAARLLPAAAGVATVPVLYVVARRAMGRRAAAWAPWMLALSPFHLFFSQFCRYYTLVALFGLLAAFAFLVGVERGRTRALALGMALLALAFFTHWSAGLLGAGAVVYVLWRELGSRPPRGLTWGRAAIVLGPALIGLLVMGGWFLQFLSGWGPWAFDARAFALALLKTVGRFDPFVLALAIGGVVAALRRRDPRGPWLTAFAAIPVAGVILMVGLSRGGTRFMLVALPVATLAAADALARLRLRRPRLGAVMAVLTFACLATQVTLYFTVEAGQRPRWREAAAYVKAHRRSGALVATAPGIVAYYSGGKAADLTGLRPPGAADAALVRSPDGLWVVVERTRNVAPPPRLARWLRQYGGIRRAFPLRVRGLDYGIDVYRVPPVSGASRGTRTNTD